MSIIKTHDITLCGGDRKNIVLCPMSDNDIPLLCRLNSDPEVLYWSDENSTEPYSTETVKEIYGSVSQNAYCFIVEINGVAIGECWLQKMNLPEVKSLYDTSLDVRRIDMSIGEKAYWGRGIGTQFIGMIIDFAFNDEHVDVLHCMCDDDNIRSNRIWRKYGFLLTEQKAVDGIKPHYENHYRLTRQEYINRRCKRCME